MAAVWPAYARIAAEDHGVQAAGDVERSQLDDGFVRQAKIYTQPRMSRRVTALVPGTQIRAFRAWLAAYAHRDFAWVDPVDGQTRQGRVVGGAGAVPLRQTARRGAVPMWEAELEIEGEG